MNTAEYKNAVERLGESSEMILEAARKYPVYPTDLSLEYAGVIGKAASYTSIAHKVAEHELSENFEGVNLLNLRAVFFNTAAHVAAAETTGFGITPETYKKTLEALEDLYVFVTDLGNECNITENREKQ